MSPEPDPATAKDPSARRRLRDAGTLRALSHPTRLALWELLTVHGPMTATQAAEHLDDSPSNCSFHLRQLAMHDLVVEADEIASPGRLRPWRVSGIGYTTGDDDAEPGQGVDIAVEVLTQTVAKGVLERQGRWQRQRHEESQAWRAVGGTAQTVWWVTADEAAALKAEIDALVLRHRDRLIDPAKRPRGARPVEMLALVHPFDPPSDLDRSDSERDGEGIRSRGTP